MVWDRLADAPAEKSGVMLIAMPENVALAVCELFNMAEELDALPPPATQQLPRVSA